MTESTSAPAKAEFFQITKPSRFHFTGRYPPAKIESSFGSTDLPMARPERTLPKGPNETSLICSLEYRFCWFRISSCCNGFLQESYRCPIYRYFFSQVIISPPRSKPPGTLFNGVFTCRVRRTSFIVLVSKLLSGLVLPLTIFLSAEHVFPCIQYVFRKLRHSDPGFFHLFSESLTLYISVSLLLCVLFLERRLVDRGRAA